MAGLLRRWRELVRLWMRRPLAFKFISITTISVLAVALLQGAYFGYFVTDFYAQATKVRITKSFERLAADIKETDLALRDALMLLVSDDAFLPSIRLINEYQDLQTYNRFLIDEEKRLVASRLLVRARFSLKSSSALYDASGNLVAAVNLEGGRYRLRYLSFVDRSPTVMSRLEGQSDSDYVGIADAAVDMTTDIPKHGRQPPYDKAMVHFVREPYGISLLANQYVIDPDSKNVIGRVDLSEKIDQGYLNKLSTDSGISMNFAQDSELPDELEVLDATNELASLRVSEDDSNYLAAVRYSTATGPSVITARLDRNVLADALRLNRMQLLALLIFVTTVVYWVSRLWIRSRVGRPLASVMAQIERIQRHDFQPHDLVTTGDELEQISQSLQLLAQQLEERAIALERSREDEALLVRKLAAERDSLERKVTERTAELLLAKNEADAASLAKSTFLANMSHEIRTPMNAISSWTYLLGRSQLDSKQSGQVERIASANQHLLHLINDILDFSKIEAGKVELELLDFNVEDLIINVCDLVTERALAKQLELVVRIDRFPPVLFGDPTRIQQILLNLVNNAVKFTEQGFVVVSAKVTHADDQQMLVRLEVRDTGIGMNDEQRSRLFQAFGQADVSTTRKYGGTGLGLAISQRLSELMGGSIGVDSVQGEGSTFWVEIPVPYSHAIWPPYLSNANTTITRLDILVLDDLSEARTALVESLTMLGHRVQAVDSVPALGAVADGLAASQPDQLTILVDLNGQWDDMPALSRDLRSKFGAGTNLRLAGMCFREVDGLRWESMGLDGMLRKPIAPGRLYEQLQNLWIHTPADYKQPEDTTYESQLRQRSGLRILLAEDNEFNQEIAIEVLGMVGIVPDVAANGQEAVDWVASHSYDLVLMDMQMPVMDGAEATRQLRQLPGCSHLPIIALTANAFDEDREICREAGMDDFVSKPFDTEVLFSKILANLPGTSKTVKDNSAQSAPESPVLQETIKQLSMLVGLDVDIGLKHAHRNPRFFLRLLEQFARSAPYAEIEERLNEGAQAAARIAAHSLKSMAATVGAVHVSQAAGQVETMLASPQPELSAEALQLAERGAVFTALAGGILQILEAEVVKHAVPSAPDKDSYSADWAELLHMLDAADVRAKSLSNQLRAALQSSFGSAGQGLLQRVDQYEFKEAATQLRALLARQDGGISPVGTSQH